MHVFERAFVSRSVTLVSAVLIAIAACVSMQPAVFAAEEAAAAATAEQRKNRQGRFGRQGQKGIRSEPAADSKKDAKRIRIRQKRTKTKEKASEKPAASSDSKSKASENGKPKTETTAKSEKTEIDQARKGSPRDADAQELAARNAGASRPVWRDLSSICAKRSSGWRRPPRTNRFPASCSISRIPTSAAARSKSFAARSAASARRARKCTPCSTRPCRPTTWSPAPAMKSSCPNRAIVDAARRPRRSDVLQGPARKGRRRGRFHPHRRLQGRRRADDPRKLQRAGPREHERRSSTACTTKWSRRSSRIARFRSPRPRKSSTPA